VNASRSRPTSGWSAGSATQRCSVATGSTSTSSSGTGSQTNGHVAAAVGQTRRGVVPPHQPQGRDHTGCELPEAGERPSLQPAPDRRLHAHHDLPGHRHRRAPPPRRAPTPPPPRGPDRPTPARPRSAPLRVAAAPAARRRPVARAPAAAWTAQGCATNRRSAARVTLCSSATATSARRSLRCTSMPGRYARPAWQPVLVSRAAAGHRGLTPPPPEET
jgi:hypothetical protein